MTKSLNLYPQNRRLATDWRDLIDRKPPDARTGDEIALDVMQRAGLTLNLNE